MLSILFLIVISIPVHLSASERETDSLKQLLSNKPGDAGIYYDLASAWLVKNNDSTTAYLVKAESLALESSDSAMLMKVHKLYARMYYFEYRYHIAYKSYKKVLDYLGTDTISHSAGGAFANFATHAYAIDKTDTALMYFQKAYRILKANNDTLRMAYVLNNMGDLMYTLGDYQHAYEYHKESKELNQALGSKRMVALSSMQLGMILYQWGNFESALEHYLIAQDIFTKLEASGRLAGCYTRMGILYKAWKQERQSHQYFNKAINLYNELGDTIGLMAVLPSITDLYLESEHYDSAVINSYYAASLARAKQSERSLAFAYGSLSNAYYKLGKRDSAAINNKKALELFRKMGMKHEYNANLILGARIQMDRRKYSVAGEMLDTVMDFSRNHKLDQLRIHALEAMSLLNEKMGNKRMAYDNYEQYLQLKDSVFSADKHKKLTEIEASYESTQKAKKIQLLNNQNKLNQFSLEGDGRLIRQQRIFMIVVISAILLILVLLFILIRQFRMKKAANEKLKERNIELEQGHKELLLAKQAADESDQLKTAFLANISHEVRTPLSVIMGYAELLNDENYSDDQKTEFLDIIRFKSGLLLNILDDILDLAKIESGEISLNIENIDIKKSFSELRQFFNHYKHRYNKDSLEIEYKLPEKQLDLNTDKGKMMQVLSNLLHNAFKFTDDGLIEYGCYKDNGNHTFYVMDTGIGISEEDQQNIFQRFRQADNSFTRKFSGTGLGLTIARHLVESLGGRIWLTSDIGKGTTFYFNLANQPASPDTKTQQLIH